MKVVLIGDSIRMGYQPFVAKKCKTAEVWGPVENCRHSLWALDHFQQWVADQSPDVVHVNFGLHDASPLQDGEHQIIPEQYRLCLKRFIDKVRGLTKAQMIWASTTPLYQAEKGVPMARWQVKPGANIEEYNADALEIVRREGIPVNDLHPVVVSNDFTRCLTKDGCHMTDLANQLLSDAVVKAIAAVL